MSQKISQFTQIVTLASGDFFPVVQASGVTNKSIQVGALDQRYFIVASGNFAQSTANTALASGNFAQSTGTTALASGNAALTLAASKGDVTLAGTQTLTNKTLTDPAIIGTTLEDIFTITDAAAFEVDPGNGSIQLITLGASRTPKCTNMVAGESVTLMVDDGTAYTITWTDATWGTGGVVWKTNAGAAPTLNTAGYTVIVLWKVSTQVYGARVGDA
jgi:hypothetical protein